MPEDSLHVKVPVEWGAQPSRCSPGRWPGFSLGPTIARAYTDQPDHFLVQASLSEIVRLNTSFSGELSLQSNAK